MKYGMRNKPNKNSLIIGRHPLVDAIESGTSIEKILLQQGTRGEFEKTIRRLSKQYNIPFQVVPKERLQQISSKNHQGVIAFISPLSYQKIEDIIPLIYEKSETPLFVILDGVTDVRNFGAIARSAEICGAHAIIIPKKGSATITDEAIKTSAGALTKIPVCREHSLVNTIDVLMMNGIQVFASDLQAKDRLQDLDLTQPAAIVMGSEGDGISKAVRQKVDNLFIIPQKGTTNSLNVSVATGIILYESLRQRGV